VFLIESISIMGKRIDKVFVLYCGYFGW